MTFSYTASDGTLTASSTATLDLTPVNDGPVASPMILAAMAEDSGARLITAAELLAGVTDVDGPALSITALAVQSGQGSLVDNGDGTWSYTPALNDDSAVTFSYTASDGTLTASSTATLDLTSVNDAPITDHVLINTNKNTPIPGKLGATDVDGGDTIVFSVETDPQHGTLDLHPDGSYTYSPTAGYSGSDSFTFKATDSGGLFTIGTADITVANSTAQVRNIVTAISLDEAVNTPSSSGVDISEVTALADGGHVVVWSS